jgi:hypothetical protein
MADELPTQREDRIATFQHDSDQVPPRIYQVLPGFLLGVSLSNAGPKFRVSRHKTGTTIAYLRFDLGCPRQIDVIFG